MANYKKQSGVVLADKLRKAVLQSAIQGQLVAQKAEDGLASELLRDIQAKKQRLIDEKVIKKEKPLAPISDDEKPFDIPDSWVWVRLGDVFSIVRGGSPRPIQSFLTTAENGLNWIKIGDTDIGGKYITSCKEKIKPEGLVKTRFVQKGDLLLTNSMSFGRPYILDVDGCIHDGWLSLSPIKKELAKEYFYYLLSSSFIKQQFNESVSGAVVKNLNSDKVKEVLIPLPPLSEQERIVAKLDEILPQIDELATSENALNALQSAFPKQMQSALLQSAISGKLTEQLESDGKASDLLTQIQAEKQRLIDEKVIKREKPLADITDDEKPFDIPENWVWVRLGEVLRVNPRNKAEDNIDCAFMPMNLLEDGYKNAFMFETRKWGEVKSGFTHFAENDVVFAKITPCFQNRKSAIIAKVPNKIGAGTTELHVLRNYVNAINLKYILYFVKNPIFIDKGVGTFTGTAGQQRISTDFVKDYLFPLPPLAEQERIVAKLDELLPQVQSLAV